MAAGAALGLAEMIAGGTTCIADMYMHTGTIAQEIMKAGISANLSCGGVYFGAPEDFSPEKCNDCRNQQELTQQWHGAGDGGCLHPCGVYLQPAPVAVDGRLRRPAQVGHAGAYL